MNYILNSQHGKRIAVILNEFGEEIGVERAMINEGEGGAIVEEWVELANGCICCTVKHSLVQALEQLVLMKERYLFMLYNSCQLYEFVLIVSVTLFVAFFFSVLDMHLCVLTRIETSELWYELDSELGNTVPESC